MKEIKMKWGDASMQQHPQVCPGMPVQHQSDCTDLQSKLRPGHEKQEPPLHPEPQHCE
ncbi:TPA: hypothetical protein ACH3X2_008769 [Trebouxia sp. C0005]